MKAIAQTKKPIMLIDPQSRDLLEQTPSVVTWSAFFEARTGKGQIRVLESDLPPEATNEEFQKFREDSENDELAIAAFVSKFKTEEVEPVNEDRAALEAKAQELEVSFRSNTSDAKLAERVAEAEAKAVAGE